jgi:hypothetical protein
MRSGYRAIKNGIEEPDVGRVLKRDDVQVDRQQNANAQDNDPDKELALSDRVSALVPLR